MKKLSHRLLMCLLVGVMVMALLATACGGSDSSDESDDGDIEGAPTLPPVYTLVPDFGDFANAEAASASTDDAGVNVQLASFAAADSDSVSPAADVIDNYLHAAGHVGFWNLVIVVGLAVPVWSFTESFNHDPVEQDDGSWIWSYSAHIGGVLHTAELQGAFVDNEVHWDMYITKEGHYEDFNWYSGVCNLPATEGYWIIQEGPNKRHDLLRIDWERNPSEGTWNVKYTNIKEGGAENGGYIHYGVTTDEPYDAFYDIYNKGQDNLVEIEANRTTEEGRVKNERHFGDDEWHYWDSSHSDTEAPS